MIRRKLEKPIPSTNPHKLSPTRLSQVPLPSDLLGSVSREFFPPGSQRLIPARVLARSCPGAEPAVSESGPQCAARYPWGRWQGRARAIASTVRSCRDVRYGTALSCPVAVPEELPSHCAYPGLCPCPVPGYPLYTPTPHYHPPRGKSTRHPNRWSHSPCWHTLTAPEHQCQLSMIKTWGTHVTIPRSMSSTGLNCSTSEHPAVSLGIHLPLPFPTFALHSDKDPGTEDPWALPGWQSGGTVASQGSNRGTQRRPQCGPTRCDCFKKRHTNLHRTPSSRKTRQENWRAGQPETKDRDGSTWMLRSRYVAVTTACSLVW